MQWLQPDLDLPAPTPFEIEMRGMRDSIRQDVEVAALAGKYGRITIGQSMSLRPATTNSLLRNRNARRHAEPSSTSRSRSSRPKIFTKSGERSDQSK